MTEKVRILAVDDNADALFALEEFLRSKGFEVLTATDGQEALDLALAEEPDMFLLDVRMPILTGYEVTQRIKSHPRLKYRPVLLLTSLNETEDLEEGFHAGADDYVTKPFIPAELLLRISAALRTRSVYQELSRAHDQNRELVSTLKDRSSFASMIGESSPMQDVYRLIERVADSNVPILITGESGTGKELVARALHTLSSRKDAALVVQNCSAFSEQLLESELFGHIRGSFTGALRDKPGLFRMADRGSFFLDELGEMGAPLQAKLLRAVQEGTFTPVGDTKEHRVDVRIITATHRNLAQMVKEGKFREDLYYRLNVIHIHLPPLRERKDDIPLLISYFLKKKGRSIEHLSKDALALLIDFPWPGNIRQLENEIERLHLLGDKEALTKDHLSKEVQGGNALIKEGTPPLASTASLPDAVAELERTMIQQTLKNVSGNKSEAARVLGISRSNLISKVKDYGMEENETEGPPR